MDINNISNSTDNEDRENCPTILLDDDPVDKDSFGSHQRIANALADLIEHEDGGRAIALIGSRGSGKSTIVKILDKNFLNSDDLKVFIFDAWTHEGDPLRRSFLENLVEFLDEQSWTDKKTWHDDIEEIRRRKDEVEKTSTPILSLWGALIALSIILLPIFAPYYPYFAVFPILIFIIAWLSYRPTVNIFKNEFWTKHRKQHEKDSLITIFINKTKEITNIKTIRTPDPTSIEFQEKFKNIMGTVLADTNKRLIIVIDNLDRVSDEDALFLWSTMRSFFDLKDSDSWKHKLWLLVPFATDTPKRLWENEYKANKGTTKKKDIEVPERDKPVNDFYGERAESFVDKTFQSVFTVPPPILSDWKEYFKQQFAKALPKHHDNYDIYLVYGLFEKIGIPSSRPPTPREINIFLNKVGSYHRIWGDEKIPLSMQALYVLVKDKLENRNISKLLFDSQFLKSNVKYLVKNIDWRKYIAALHFNVDPNKAMQVLLTPKFGEAINSSQSDELKEIKKDIPGFADELHRYISDRILEWSETENNMITNTALVINELDDEKTPEFKLIWRGLKTGAEDCNWDNIDEDVGKGIGILLDKCPDTDRDIFIKSIISHIKQPETKVSEDEKKQGIDSNVIKKWVKGLVFIIKKIESFGFKNILEDELNIPGDSNFYIEVMKNHHGENIIKYFKPSTEVSDIIGKLTNIVKEEKFDGDYAEAIYAMSEVKIQWEWDKLIASLNERLQTNLTNPEDIDGCIRGLMFLIEYSEEENAKNILKDLCKNGHIFNLLNNIKANEVYVPICILPILEFLPDAKNSNPTQNVQKGLQYYDSILKNPSENIINGLSEIVEEFDKVGMIIIRSDKYANTKKLGSKIIKNIVNNREKSRNITPEILIEYYHKLKALLDDKELEKVTLTSIESDDLVNITQNYNFDVNITLLYLAIYRLCSDVSKHNSFVKYLQNGFKDIERERWEKALENEDELLELLITLSNDNVVLDLSSNLQIALFNCLKNVLIDKYYPKKYEKSWSKIFYALSDGPKETLIRYVRDEIIRYPDKPLVKLINIFGEELLYNDILEEKSDDFVRHCIANIIERKSVEELKWVEKLIRNKKGLIEQSNIATIDHLKEQLKSEWNTVEEDEIKNEIESIAELLNLELTDESIETDNDSGEPDKND